jgi:hypothetical protein
MKPKSWIKYERAIDLMRGGGRLCKMHNGGGGFTHYLVPGGLVTTDTAEKIKQHPFVHPGQDGLFPGLDQTWAMHQVRTPELSEILLKTAKHLA